MDKKMIFRIAMIALLLYLFYTMGVPLEALAILGIVFVALILLRGKIWKKTDALIEKFLPFTRQWPELAQKALLIIIFFLFYMILKQVIYFLLGIMGINIEEILLKVMQQ